MKNARGRRREALHRHVGRTHTTTIALVTEMLVFMTFFVPAVITCVSFPRTRDISHLERDHTEILFMCPKRYFG